MVRGRQAKKESKAPRRVSSRSHADPDVIVAIQDSKRIGGVDHFLVKWSQSSKKDSWEPATEVKKVAKSLIADYEETQSQDQEYEVESLVDRKRVGNAVKYLVKWKGFGSDDNTWEEASGIPANLVKKFDNQYGPLAPKRTKKEAAAEGEGTDGDEAEASPKKKPKRKSKPVAAAPKSTDISTIYNRKIINNVLHYEVKFVGVNSKKDVPIFEIQDLDAIVAWEREHFAEGVTHIDEEHEFTVEKILARKGTGKSLKYRVKWMGYKNSENTWEKVDNLGGAKKMIDEFDKLQDEREARLAEKDYIVERITEERFHKGETWFMVKWKGYTSNSNSWEPEESLKESAQDVIAKWQVEKVKKAERKEAAQARAAVRKEERKAKKEADKEAKKAEKEAAKEAKSAAETSATADEKETDEAAAAAEEPAATEEPAAEEAPAEA